MYNSWVYYTFILLQAMGLISVGSRKFCDEREFLQYPEDSLWGEPFPLEFFLV